MIDFDELQRLRYCSTTSSSNKGLACIELGSLHYRDGWACVLKSRGADCHNIQLKIPQKNSTWTVTSIVRCSRGAVGVH